jgi:hypothetical protein
MAVDILGQTWSISQKGQDIITENNTVNDKTTLLKNALNSDLKEIGSPVLAKNANKANISQVMVHFRGYSLLTRRSCRLFYKSRKSGMFLPLRPTRILKRRRAC